MQFLQDNKRLSCDGDFDIYTWFEGDRSDLSDDVRGSSEIDQTLVDLEFVSVPSL